jgi:hypothetical protein
VEPIDDDLGPRHLRFDRPHEAFIHIRARALDREPQGLGHRAQEGHHRFLLAVREHRQELDPAPCARHRHQHDEIAVPGLSAISSIPITPSRSQTPQSTACAI